MADRIRAARKGKGFDQKRLAELTGIDRKTIGHYERGKTEPGDIYLDKLVEHLDCDRGWLLTGIPPRNESDGDGGQVIVLARQGRNRSTRRYARFATVSAIAA